MTEEHTTIFGNWYSINEDAHLWIAFSTQDFPGSTGFQGFLIFSTTVET